MLPESNSFFCVYCGASATAEPSVWVRCPACESRYHFDCWRDNGDRCSVLGCIGQGSPDQISAQQDSTVTQRKRSYAMQIGEVKTCAHCDGTGTCEKSHYYSCAGCLLKAGLNPVGQSMLVPCSACGGAGSIWVGPTNIQLPAK